MSNLLKHFDKEIEILKRNHKQEDGNLIIQDYIQKIREILEIFSSQGHSGFSASFYSQSITSTLKNALSFKALSPLTGDDTEWFEYAPDEFQNNRQGSVFKKITQEGVETSFLDGIVWQGEDKYDTFTGTVEGVSSSVKVNFPLVTKTFYVDVRKVQGEGECEFDHIELDGNAFHYVIKDESQLKEAEEYYNTPHTQKD